jgi:protoheme IX farnesyltransferase
VLLAFTRVVTRRPLVPSRLTSAFSHVGLRPARTTFGAYVALTKPRIIELLLITTVPAMVLAQGGWPDTRLVVWTVVGGALAAGGANAINMYIDRDIDQLMERTRNRPLVTGRVSPRNALVFAVALEIAAFAVLFASSNLLAALLAIAATLFYVFVYSLWLKRTSRQNIVIGGAAGAVPVLVGWAAVDGSISWSAVVLFLVIFLWTPPHFWALAIRHADDYRAASVPMLPVVETSERTVRTMGFYSVAVALASFALIPLNDMGVIYTSAAALLGVVFVALTFGLGRAPTQTAAMRVFSFSISYITLLFAAAMIDVLVSSR